MHLVAPPPAHALLCAGAAAPALSSRRQAILALALATATSSPLAALAAAELTEEQSLIVEAWATVQRGYVDQQFGGKDWKAVKSDYLGRKYKSMGEARESISAMLGLLGDRTRAIHPGARTLPPSTSDRPTTAASGDAPQRGHKRQAAGTGRDCERCGGAPAEAGAAGGLAIFEAIDGRPLAAGATADDTAGPRPARRAIARGRAARRRQHGERRAAPSLLKAGEATARSATAKGGSASAC